MASISSRNLDDPRLLINVLKEDDIMTQNLNLDLNLRRIMFTTTEDEEYEVYRVPLKRQARLGTQARLDETAELERMFLVVQGYTAMLQSIGWTPPKTTRGPKVDPKPKNGRKKKAAS